MRPLSPIRAAVAGVLGVAALVALPAAAGASTAHDGHDGHDGFGFHAQHAVFVQTDNPAGNQVLVYDEAANGTLTPAGTYSTGGLGAQAAGSVVDHLASQGSLVYEAAQQLLVAVNAGSDTVSVFAVRGDRLFLREVLPSGGDFPDSIAVNDHVAYVLNAGGAGSVSGFRVFDGALVPLPGSTRSLGLANTSPPNYLSSPGQVAFSPDGSQLLVTTKASTNAIDVFGVSWNGWLSAAPVVNASSAPVPFALVFAPNGQAVVAQAGNSSVGTYALAGNGTLTNLSTLPDGQTALCWITGADGFYYVANAGSATLSAYTVSPSGVASLVGTTGVVATTDAGPIDMAASADGSTLYVEAGGAGAVDEFHVNADGSLTSIGSVTGLGAGIEGIAAS